MNEFVFQYIGSDLTVRADGAPVPVAVATRNRLDQLTRLVNTAESARDNAEIRRSSLVLGTELHQLLRLVTNERVRDFLITLPELDGDASPTQPWRWRWEALVHPTILQSHSRNSTLAVLHSSRSVAEARGTELESARCLFLTASPAGVSPVDGPDEYRRMAHAVEKSVAEITVEPLQHGSVEALAKKVQDRSFDIVHVSTHGLKQDGRVLLQLEAPNRESHLVSAAELWRILSRRTAAPRLIVLSTCFSSTTTPDYLSFAHELVRAGAPAVLGWARAVLDDTAIEATASLYNALSRGNSVIEAVARTRRRLWSSDHWEFWVSMCLVGRTSSDVQLRVAPRVNRHDSPDPADELQTGQQREFHEAITKLQGDRCTGLSLVGARLVGKSAMSRHIISALRRDDPSLVLVHISSPLSRLDIVAATSVDGISGRRIQETSINPGLSPAHSLQAAASKWSRPRLFVMDEFESNFQVDPSGSKLLGSESAKILDAVLRVCTDSKHRVLIVSRLSLAVIEPRLSEVSVSSYSSDDCKVFWRRGRRYGGFRGWTLDDWLELCGRFGHNPGCVRALNAMAMNLSQSEIEESLPCDFPTGNVSESDSEIAEILGELCLSGVQRRVATNFRSFLNQAAVFRAHVPVAALVEFLPPETTSPRATLDLLADYELLERGDFQGEPAFRVSWIVAKLESPGSNAQTYEHSARFWRSAIDNHAEAPHAWLFFAWTDAVACKNEQLADTAVVPLAALLIQSNLIQSALDVTNMHCASFPGSATGAHWSAYVTQISGDLDRAEKQSRIAVQLCDEQGIAPSSYQHCASRHRLAAILYERGALIESTTLLREILRDEESSPGSLYETGAAVTLYELSRNLRTLGESQEAFDAVSRAHSALEEALPESQSYFAACLYERAGVEFNLGNTSDAERHLRKCLVLREEEFGMDHGILIQPLVDLSRVLRRSDNMPESATISRRAVDLCRRIGNEESAAAARARSELGQCLLETSGPGAALPEIREALRIARTVHSDVEHAVTAEIQIQLAEAISRSGDRERAIAEYQSARDTLGRFYGGPRHVQCLNALGPLAEELRDNGQYVESVATYVEILQIFMDRETTTNIEEKAAHVAGYDLIEVLLFLAIPIRIGVKKIKEIAGAIQIVGGLSSEHRAAARVVWGVCKGETIHDPPAGTSPRFASAFKKIISEDALLLADLAPLLRGIVASIEGRAALTANARRMINSLENSPTRLRRQIGRYLRSIVARRPRKLPRLTGNLIPNELLGFDRAVRDLLAGGSANPRPTRTR